MFKKIDYFVKFSMFFLFCFFLFHNLYSLDKNSYKPKEKIFTPNGDGVNDTISFPNLDTEKNVTIRIFNVNGKKIRTLGYPYVWDGRDTSGKLLESGVYVYQFKINADGNSEYISGTIVLAK